MTTRTVIPIREFLPYREPMLEEILSDPITRAVMRADGVDPAKLRTMLSRIGEAIDPECASVAWPILRDARLSAGSSG